MWGVRYDLCAVWCECCVCYPSTSNTSMTTACCMALYCMVQECKMSYGTCWNPAWHGRWLARWRPYKSFKKKIRVNDTKNHRVNILEWITWSQLMRNSLREVMWEDGDIARKRFKSEATRWCKHVYWNNNQIDITDAYTVQYPMVRYNNMWWQWNEIQLFVRGKEIVSKWMQNQPIRSFHDSYLLQEDRTEEYITLMA